MDKISKIPFEIWLKISSHLNIDDLFQCKKCFSISYREINNIINQCIIEKLKKSQDKIYNIFNSSCLDGYFDLIELILQNFTQYFKHSNLIVKSQWQIGLNYAIHQNYLEIFIILLKYKIDFDHIFFLCIALSNYNIKQSEFFNKYFDTKNKIYEKKIFTCFADICYKYSINNKNNDCVETIAWIINEFKYDIYNNEFIKKINYHIEILKYLDSKHFGIIKIKKY